MSAARHAAGTVFLRRSKRYVQSPRAEDLSACRQSDLHRAAITLFDSAPSSSATASIPPFPKSRRRSLKSTTTSPSSCAASQQRRTRSSASPRSSFRFRDLSAYVADDWKVNSQADFESRVCAGNGLAGRKRRTAASATSIPSLVTNSDNPLSGFLVPRNAGD